MVKYCVVIQIEINKINEIKSKCGGEFILLWKYVNSYNTVKSTINPKMSFLILTLTAAAARNWDMRDNWRDLSVSGIQRRYVN